MYTALFPDEVISISMTEIHEAPPWKSAAAARLQRRGYSGAAAVAAEAAASEAAPQTDRKIEERPTINFRIMKIITNTFLCLFLGAAHLGGQQLWKVLYAQNNRVSKIIGTGSWNLFFTMVWMYISWLYLS